MKKHLHALLCILCSAVLFACTLSASALDDEALDMYDRIQNLLLFEDGADAGDLSGKQKAANYVFIGDSRTVGMQSAVGGDAADSWSAKVSMGYNWMVSEGIPNVESAIGNGTAVFILLGINDLGNVNSYISYVDAKAAEWNERGAATYFCAVGPVGNTTVTNAQIENFNSTVSSNLVNAVYIDLYTDLMNNGFSTQDGLHYTNDTYVHIYQMLKNIA